MIWRCDISTTKVSVCCKICQKVCCFKTEQNAPILPGGREEHKILHTVNKAVLFLCWHKSLYRYRVNLLYRTARRYVLFNLTRFICCVSERSIHNVLMLSQSRCCLYQEQLHVSVSTNRQHNVPKQYKNSIHINWTYVAFSVLDHNSLQSLVIQQLAVTQLFCTA